jgi:hypothetical protein
MQESNGYAEQCKDWSDEDPACLDRHIAQAARHDWQATTDLHPPAYPGLFDYAVHALWQTPVSLCNGARAWPQVLSVGEQSGTTPDPDLCPARHGGASAGAVGSVTDGARARRGVVRHWLRIAPAPGGQITRSDGVGQFACDGVSDRYHGRQSPRGQHVGTRGERSALVHAVTGGGTPCARR